MIEALEKLKISSRHYIIFVICFLAYMLTAMNVMLISVLLKPIALEWNLTDLELGYLISAGFVGMFIGAILFGRLADLIGRKVSLILALTLHSIFTAACGISWNFESFFLFRFIAGIGLGGALPIPGAYMSEYIPAEKRGTFVGLIETSWVWGVLLGFFLSLFSLPSYGWRITFYWGLLALALIPFAFVLLPESIRYLLEKKKFDKAKEILKSFGIEVKEIKYEKSRKIRISDLFRGIYARRTILLLSLWFILVYTYYGVFIWLPKLLAMKYPLIASIVWAIIITLAQIPGYYSAAFLLDKIGRKKVLIIYLTGATIGCLLVAFAYVKEIGIIQISNLNIGALMFTGFLIVSFFNLGAWSALYTYTPELYPTEYRGTGSGLAAASGRLAGILQPLIVPILAMSGWITAYISFAVAHGIGALLTFILGEETRGRILEELSH